VPLAEGIDLHLFATGDSSLGGCDSELLAEKKQDDESVDDGEETELEQVTDVVQASSSELARPSSTTSSCATQPMTLNETHSTRPPSTESASATTTRRVQSAPVPETASASAGNNSLAASATLESVPERRKKKKSDRVTFDALRTEYEIVDEVVRARGWTVVKEEEKAPKCYIHWIDQAGIDQTLPTVMPWMRVNHFPGMNNSLARKSRLAKNMARISRYFAADYRFLPATWVLPEDMGDLEKRFDNGESKAIFIVKPDHLCQGKGIFLTTNLDRIKKASPPDQFMVVQRYLGRPMLIEGFKFDLRLYLLVGGKVSGDIADSTMSPRLHLFRDGLVRLCTVEYEPPKKVDLDDDDEGNLDKKCMHLTNYAINKNNENFDQPDEDDGAGSKRSLRWFMDYIEEEFGEKERKKLWEKMKALCVKMILTVWPTLEAEYFGVFPKDLSGGRMPCRCWELLGVDVMLDHRHKPYLIEVNHLPSFTTDSPLDDDIKRRVVDQVLHLTCSDVTAQDKANYDMLCKERRELRQGPQVGNDQFAMDVDGEPAKADLPSESPLDLPNFKDFERCFPHIEPESAKGAKYETILAKAREFFRPVHKPKAPKAPKDTVGQPQPPKLPPKLPQVTNQRPGAEGGPKGKGGPQRSRSLPPAPGRRGLPSLTRSPSEGPATRSDSRDSRSHSARIRVAPVQRRELQLKSAHISF
jgi:tubulin polyglutamylase TTLL6/13